MAELKDIKVGKEISGTVYKVEDNQVLVDCGYVTEGVIHKEFLTVKKISSCKEVVKVGDQIKAVVKKVHDGDDFPVLLLSCIDLEKKALYFDEVKKIRSKEPFTATVKKVVKDGLLLESNSVELFLPDKLVDLEEVDKKTLVGKEVTVKYVAENKETKQIVVDRKSLQYLAKKEARDNEFNSFNVDDVVTGTVVRVVEYGAFVKFNLIEGLIPFTELSHYHIKAVTDVVNEGEEVTVKVIKKTDSKLTLSVKALQEKPWDLFLANHKAGEEVEVKVVKKMQFGLLCEIEREVCGVINRQDYSWNPEYNLAGEVSEGDTLTVKILAIDKKNRKVALSKKHLEYNPWADVTLRKGDLVSATVVRFEEKAVVLQVGNVEGTMGFNDYSVEPVKVEDHLHVGDVIEAEVVSCYPKEWKLTLSKKVIEIRKNRETYEEYLKENVSSSTSLKDLLK